MYYPCFSPLQTGCKIPRWWCTKSAKRLCIELQALLRRKIYGSISIKYTHLLYRHINRFKTEASYISDNHIRRVNQALYNRVSAVNNDVATSRIARDIRSQIQERPFELMCFTFATTQSVSTQKKDPQQRHLPHGDFVPPYILRLYWNKI